MKTIEQMTIPEVNAFLAEKVCGFKWDELSDSWEIPYSGGMCYEEFRPAESANHLREVLAKVPPDRQHKVCLNLIRDSEAGVRYSSRVNTLVWYALTATPELVARAIVASLTEEPKGENGNG